MRSKALVLGHCTFPSSQFPDSLLKHLLFGGEVIGTAVIFHFFELAYYFIILQLLQVLKVHPRNLYDFLQFSQFFLQLILALLKLSLNHFIDP
mmetsp:Transcript_19062/g.18196  ORF Transcript_19062/g.18196 Transcript_19062/m.18196 type:complete len:93 (+) Transcript_19062:312-590(+)